MNDSHQPKFVEEFNDIHINLVLDSISTNLDEEDTLDDDEHDIIDVDVDLLNMIST